MAEVKKTEKIDGATRYHIKHGLKTVVYDIADTFTKVEAERTLLSYMVSLEQTDKLETLTKNEINDKFARMKGEAKPSVLDRLLRRK
jgi:hypothetical protein